MDKITRNVQQNAQQPAKNQKYWFWFSGKESEQGRIFYFEAEEIILSTQFTLRNQQAVGNLGSWRKVF